MYSEAYLNHYADLFVALRLARHGVSLEQYLTAPESYEGWELEPEELLPEQQAVVDRLSDAELGRIEKPVADMPRRNGVIVEPLKKRSHPKYSTAAHFTPRVRR